MVKKKIKLMGISNIVGSWNSLHRVLFFDTDSLDEDKYQKTIRFLTEKSGLLIMTIETSKGYHIISPVILKYSEMFYFLNKMFQIYPETDYRWKGRLNNYGARYHVLRIIHKPKTEYFNTDDLRLREIQIPDKVPSKYRKISYDHLIHILSYSVPSIDPDKTTEFIEDLRSRGYNLLSTGELYIINYWSYIEVLE